jgi:hypothetical protein
MPHPSSVQFGTKPCIFIVGAEVVRAHFQTQLAFAKALETKSKKLNRTVLRRRLSWARSPMPMKHKDCEERNEPATLTERGLAAI